MSTSKDPIHGWAAVGLGTVILISLLILQLFLFLIGAGFATSSLVVDVALFSSLVLLARATMQKK